MENLSSVYFPNGNEGWAVGGAGTILNTTDGGVNWSLQTSGTEAFLLGVSFIDNQIGYAVGFPNINGEENLLHTTNGGATWSNSSPSAFTSYYAVDIIDFGNGAIVGTNNFPSEGVTVQLLGTTNFNYRTPVPIGVTTELRDVDFVDTGGTFATGYAVGNGGVIVKSTSGGTIWSSVTSPTTKRLLGVSFVDENVGWAVGSEGTIIHTVDGGNSWVSQTSNTFFALNDVHFVDENTGWAVGNLGVLLHTTDGGNTWNFEDVGTDRNLSGIYFTDSDNGWAVGHDGTVLKYSNTTPNPAAFTVNTADQGTDFGTAVRQNNAGPTRTYTITNAGTVSLTGITVASDDGDFTVTAASPTTIAAGETATFQVTLGTGSVGAKTATITINTTEGVTDMFGVSGDVVEGTVFLSETGLWYAGLQEAIDAATGAGDIFISPGVYDESADFSGTSLTIKLGAPPE